MKATVHLYGELFKPRTDNGNVPSTKRGDVSIISKQKVFSPTFYSYTFYTFVTRWSPLLVLY